MKIKLIAVGKTDSPEIESLYNEYIKRLCRLSDFEFSIIPDIKNSKSLTEAEQKEREGVLILLLFYLMNGEKIILLNFLLIFYKKS